MTEMSSSGIKKRKRKERKTILTDKREKSSALVSQSFKKTNKLTNTSLLKHHGMFLYPCFVPMFFWQVCFPCSYNNNRSELNCCLQALEPSPDCVKLTVLSKWPALSRRLIFLSTDTILSTEEQQGLFLRRQKDRVSVTDL